MLNQETNGKKGGDDHLKCGGDGQAHMLQSPCSVWLNLRFQAKKQPFQYIQYSWKYPNLSVNIQVCDIPGNNVYEWVVKVLPVAEHLSNKRIVNSMKIFLWLFWADTTHCTEDLWTCGFILRGIQIVTLKLFTFFKVLTTFF